MIKKEEDLAGARKLRIKAEEQLKENPKNAEKLIVITDVQKLLHELQVHQIELEMQNEELRMANETAEEALKKYTILYDFSPMGYFTLDTNAMIIDLNFTGADLLKDRRFALENCNFKLFISEDTLPSFNQFFNKVYDSNKKESCHVKLGYHNHQLIPVYIEGIVTGEDRKCLLSVVDKSGFRK